ncbi:MAG: hypothetical protein AAF289_02690 [Cyanobacteria bacterium P01_A01_bin.135]
MNRLTRTAAVALIMSSIGTLSALAAPLSVAQIDPALIALSRAKNLARQAGERANGGIIAYRAEPAMHGPAEDAPYVENVDGGWTFTFQGCDRSLIGADGRCLRYSVETVVTVLPEGEVTLNENRALR